MRRSTQILLTGPKRSQVPTQLTAFIVPFQNWQWSFKFVLILCKNDTCEFAGLLRIWSSGVIFYMHFLATLKTNVCDGVVDLHQGTL